MGTPEDAAAENYFTPPEKEILKKDAPLYIDVACYVCGRRVAMSYTTERDGRRYCQRCV
ncbi:hypothetical protein LCGC14_2744310 [marine sediment metagenome]|uniref:Uncharacterized protein n=1 Tax=marine sediment metagenome TaxID=412755 RepID=A0A0F9BV96_9ZZZZ